MLQEILSRFRVLQAVEKMKSFKVTCVTLLKCFPVDFAKFLRKPFLQNISERLLVDVNVAFLGRIRDF